MVIHMAYGLKDKYIAEKQQYKIILAEFLLTMEREVL